MNNIRWIFFDLDGTLVNNISLMYTAYLNFLSEYGFSGNKKEFAKLNGPSLKEIIVILKKNYSKKQNHKYQQTYYKMEVM